MLNTTKAKVIGKILKMSNRYNMERLYLASKKAENKKNLKRGGIN
jgi:hypothetical protein